MSLQYLKKEGRDKVYYLNGKKHQLFYRLIRLILVDMTRHSQIIQSNKFTKFFWYPKKEVGDEVEFLYRWVSKFSTNWCYHFWWAWLGMPKVTTIKIIKYQINHYVMSLQYLKKRNWAMMLMFCMLINIIVFYKLMLYNLMGLARYSQSIRSSLQCPCDILRKKLAMICTSWFKYYSHDT